MLISIPNWYNSKAWARGICYRKNKFQFQTGTIQRIQDLVTKNEPQNFNSKLVQFKVDYATAHPYSFTEFQFQTGTIQSFITRAKDKGVSNFNSKLVQFKAQTICAGQEKQKNFNSKLVQFKDAC